MFCFRGGGGCETGESRRFRTGEDIRVRTGEDIRVRMPVFHTKTIESILDPVAQQVSSRSGRK